MLTLQVAKFGGRSDAKCVESEATGVERNEMPRSQCPSSIQEHYHHLENSSYLWHEPRFYAKSLQKEIATLDR